MHSILTRIATRRLAAGAALLILSGAAAAHPGHDGHGLLAGLSHPFGLDHLLAMAAVGLWSVAALKGSARWQGPLAFLAPMCFGALMGMGAGMDSAAGVPGLELALAASVVLMGALLLGTRQIAAPVGMGLIAVAGALHGWAHGSEMPAALMASGQAWTYGLGFVLTTALLHAGGLFAGMRLERFSTAAWRVAAGAGVGAAGLALVLARI